MEHIRSLLEKFAVVYKALSNDIDTEEAITKALIRYTVIRYIEGRLRKMKEASKNVLKGVMVNGVSMVKSNSGEASAELKESLEKIPDIYEIETFLDSRDLPRELLFDRKVVYSFNPWKLADAIESGNIREEEFDGIRKKKSTFRVKDSRKLKAVFTEAAKALLSD